REFILAKPRDAKIKLARHIITWLHSKEAADAAEAEFIKVFTKHEAPDEMPEVQVGSGPQKLAPIIVRAGLASSNSEAIRKNKADESPSSARYRLKNVSGGRPKRSPSVIACDLLISRSPRRILDPNSRWPSRRPRSDALMSFASIKWLSTSRPVTAASSCDMS